MDVLCKKCNGKMFTKNMLDEENLAIDPDDGLAWKSEEGKRFFVCPICAVKNIVKIVPSKDDGPSQIFITHFED